MADKPVYDESFGSLLREHKSNKTDWAYLYDLYPVFEAIMQHFMAGAEKYDRLNFLNCTDPRTYEESQLRHLLQDLDGQTDENHNLAVIVNGIIREALKMGIKHPDADEPVSDLANMGCTCNDCRLKSVNKEKGNEPR